MPSNAFQLGKLLISSGEVKISPENVSDDFSTIEQVSSTDALSASGNAVGDQRIVGNNLYIWNGTGWYRIALINQTPTWDSGGQPAATYNLNTDSPAVPTIITLNATDPDGLPIQYSHITGGQMDSIATISQDSSVFTITPKSAAQAPNGGTGSVTFRASDGVNILPYVSSFTLQFAYDWSAATQTADLSYVGGTNNLDAVEGGSDYGWDVTISRDGLKVVIGARDKGWTQNVNPSVMTDGNNRGAVYTWTRPDKDSSWTQHYPIQNSSNDQRDHFGNQVALSADGNYLAVGAHQEGGGTIDTNYGAVYIFTPNGNSWTEVAHIYPSSRVTNGKFGEVLDIDDDGDTMIVGAPYEPGSTVNYGALYFYSRSGSTWTMDLKTNPYSSSLQNRYGYSVSIAGDGLTACVGVPFDDTGGAQKGAVHVYTRSGSTWTLAYTLQGSNTVAGDYFGTSVDISRDGLTIAVGCGGDDTSNTDSGSVYVFKWSGSAWVEEAHLIASDENTNAYNDPWAGGLGFTPNSVSLSDDGNVLFAGAIYWRGGTNTVYRNGQGYIFQRDGSTWTESKRFGSISGDVTADFGYSGELSGDGGSVIVGAQANSTVWVWEA